MKLTQRANGIWMVDKRSSGGGRFSTGTRCLEEAKKIAKGEPVPTLGYTFKNALDNTWDNIWVHQKSSDSRYYTVKTLSKQFGHLSVDSINYELLINWTNSLNLSASSINNYMSTVRVALTEAIKYGYLSTLPYLPRKRVDNHKIRYLTKAEERRLHNAAKDILGYTEAVTMIHLMNALVSTGCRLSELTTLEEKNFNQSQMMLLDTKNSKGRTIPLSNNAYTALRELFNSDHWSEVQSLGKRRSKDKLGRLFTKIRSYANLDDVSLHTFRHTACTRLVLAGVDIYRVMTIMGHSSIDITNRYVHLKAVHLLDDMVKI